MLQDLETLANHLVQALIEIGVASALRLEHPSDFADVGRRHGVRLTPHEVGKISTRPESLDHHLGRQLGHRQGLQALHLTTECGVRGLLSVTRGRAFVLVAEHKRHPIGTRSTPRARPEARRYKARNAGTDWPALAAQPWVPSERTLALPSRCGVPPR